MDGVTIYGFVSISVMLLAYAMEKRGRGWILVFSIGCLSSSIYGYLIGTLPFALVEGVWAIVAWKRWWGAKGQF